MPCQAAGQRDADQRHSGDDIVCAGVLLGGSQHAQRHGDDQGQHKGDAAHNNGQTDDLLELLHSGDIPLPAVAEVADDCLAQPGKEAGDNVHVQTVGSIELRQPFLVGFCTGGLCQLHCHGFGKGAGQAADQRVDNEHDTEQDQYRLRDSLDDVVTHGIFRSFLARQWPRLFLCRDLAGICRNMGIPVPRKG